ncbi:MAG: tripartite tricarboxylate transporter substrate binding protein [Ottowia sp.]
MKQCKPSQMCTRVVTALAVSAICSIPAAMAAEPYPSKPIQLISPLPTGGSTDVATRAWMECASKQGLAGHPFVLLNRPGANGVVAANTMQQQPNDGYSLMVAGMSQMTITPFIFKKQPYDPEREFEGAAIFGTTPFILVASAKSGIKSLAELKARALSKSGGIDMGMPAIASPAHLLGSAVAEKMGMPATLVPVKSEPEGVTSLLGGHVEAMVFVVGSISQQVETGSVTPLMVFTEKRLPQFPNVPTVIEALGEPGLVRFGWLGFAAKGGGSKEVIKAVEGWTRKCLETKEFDTALRNALFTPRFISASEYAEVVRKDIAFWRPWITKLKISND